MSRLLFDVSYTRTQRGSIGITRTVRRLFEELRTVRQCEPVAFHSTGFRSVEPQLEPARESTGQRGIARRAFGWLHGDAVRTMVTFALRVVPWFLLRPAWSVASTLTFNGLTRAAPAVRFAPGDTLLIADASWNYMAWRAAARAREQGAKVVLLVYDLMPLRHPQFCFPLVAPLFRTWLAKMLDCSDAVICISRATQEDLVDWASAHLGRTLPRIGHFRLGADAAQDRTAGEVREFVSAFLDDTVPCFAAVGSFEPKKNYQLLLDVFGRLWAQGVEVRLLLAGRLPADWPAIAEALRSNPQRGRLLLALHDATDAEVLAIYDRSRALLLPSLFEGFGLPLVEARSRGCPVIASNLPVFAELADDGVVLFDLATPGALEAIVREQAATNLRSRTAPMPPFTWGDSARQCLAVMETLLQDQECSAGGTEAIVPAS